MLDSEIKKVIDIYNIQKNRFYTFQELIQVYDIKFDFLFYLGLLSAIPSIWKNDINRYYFDCPLDISSLLFEPCEKPNISRIVYWDLIGRSRIHWGSKTVLETSLKITIPENIWSKLFSEFLRHIKPTKLRYFQYKILTGTLTTNKRWAKWDPNVSSTMCSFCLKQDETMLHLLVECEQVKPLWITLEKFCKYYLDIQLSFAPDCIVLNNYKGPQAPIINLMIVTLKQYIYAQKCLQKNLCFSQFVSRLSWWYSIEKQLLWADYSDKKQQNFWLKWKSIF